MAVRTQMSQRNGPRQMPNKAGSGARELNAAKTVARDGGPATRIVYREREAPNTTGHGIPNHEGR